MNFPSMPQKGSNVIQGLYNTVAQICQILPKLDVKGDNRTTFVSERSFGKIIRAKTQSSGISVAGGEEPEPSEIPIARYFNNVCRLCPDGELKYACMSYTGLSGVSLYSGPRTYNINGTMGYLPAAMTPISSIMSGNPIMLNYITYEIGVQFQLNSFQTPSAYWWSSSRPPYYWEWQAQLSTRQLYSSIHPYNPTSGTVSSHFIPIAAFSIKSTSSQTSGVYDCVLENVANEITFMTKIDSQFINMIDRFAYPKE